MASADGPIQGAKWDPLVLLREAFKKNNDETYGKFHILGTGAKSRKGV